MLVAADMVAAVTGSNAGTVAAFGSSPLAGSGLSGGGGGNRTPELGDVSAREGEEPEPS